MDVSKIACMAIEREREQGLKTKILQVLSLTLIDAYEQKTLRVL